MTDDLTIRKAQRNQPWTVPYARGVRYAMEVGDVPHILGSHALLHAAKTVGKLAAVFEALDHPEEDSEYGPGRVSGPQYTVIRNMAADLVVVALRFANLYQFDLQEALVERTTEKNGQGFEGTQQERLPG